MKVSTSTALALGLAAGLLLSSQVQAATFAEYGATSSADNLKWTSSASGLTGTLSTEGAGASAAVTFSFLIPSLGSLQNLPALLTFTGSGAAVDPAESAFGVLVQPNLSGAFNFVYTGATPLVSNGVTYTTGANLLSGTYADGAIFGLVHASAGGVSDATTSGGVISYSSDFLTFTPGADSAFALSLTSITPTLGATPGTALNSFDSVSTGSFQGAPSPMSAPEPATWAMLMLGMGAMGAVLRRRRNLALVAA